MHEGVTLHTRGRVLVAWQVSGAGTLDWWNRVLKHALIFWNESFALHSKSAPKKKREKKKEIIIIIHNLHYAGVSLNIHSVLQLPMQMPVTSRPLPFLRMDKSRPVSGCLWGKGRGGNLPRTIHQICLLQIMGINIGIRTARHFLDDI
jgi:hypothetical protein